MEIAHHTHQNSECLPPKEEKILTVKDQVQYQSGAHSLIVLSGGMDSTTMLYEYRSSIAVAVTFVYGSNHNERETACAAWHCHNLGIEHLVIPLKFIGDYFESSLLSGADSIPDGHYDDTNMRSTVVPFRNGIMLAVAAGILNSELTTDALTHATREENITAAHAAHVPNAMKPLPKQDLILTTSTDHKPVAAIKAGHGTNAKS